MRRTLAFSGACGRAGGGTRFGGCGDFASFFGAGFFAAGFLAAGFFGTGFFAAGFFAAGFLAAGFFAAGFFAAGFFAAGFFAAGFVAAVRADAGFFGAFFDAIRASSTEPTIACTEGGSGGFFRDHGVICVPL